MLVFFDSSAFAKRYVREAGSDDVLLWCEQASEIGLSGIALPEIISAFCRLSREKRISRKQHHALKVSLLEDVRDVAISMPRMSIWLIRISRYCRVALVLA